MIVVVACKLNAQKFNLIYGRMPPHIETYQNNVVKRLIVADSTKNVAWIDNDSSITVIDSSATIRIMMRQLQEMFDEMKQVNDRYYAAQEILDVLTVNGTVTDRQKFKEAVRKYQKLNQ